VLVTDGTGAGLAAPVGVRVPGTGVGVAAFATVLVEALTAARLSMITMIQALIVYSLRI